MGSFLNLFLLHENTSLHPSVSGVTNFSVEKGVSHRKTVHTVTFTLGTTRSAAVTLTVKSPRYRRRRRRQRRCGDGGARCTVFPLFPPQLSRMSDSRPCTCGVPTSGRPGYDEFRPGHFRPTGRDGRCRMEKARDRLL